MYIWINAIDRKYTPKWEWTQTYTYMYIDLQLCVTQLFYIYFFCLLFKTEILLCIKMYKYLPCKKWILYPCQSLSRSGKSEEEEKKSIRNYTTMLQLTCIQQYTILVLWYLLHGYLHVAVHLWTISNFAILSQKHGSPILNRKILDLEDG